MKGRFFCEMFTPKGFEKAIDCFEKALQKDRNYAMAYIELGITQRYITLMGNISPQDLSDKDPEYISEYAEKLIKEIAPGGGYILSSGHSINPAIKLENFLAIQETLKKFGNYPINI